jgi:hypothetical protein
LEYWTFVGSNILLEWIFFCRWGGVLADTLAVKLLRVVDDRDIYGAFNLPINSELDMTTSVVLCLIVKNFQGLDKLEGKEHDKNRDCKIVSQKIISQFFLSQVQVV